MNKLTILMCLISFGLSCFLTACVNTAQNGNNVLQYHRKFSNLNESQPKEPTGVIDLSDGTKVDFSTMPNSTNFGIK